MGIVIADLKKTTAKGKWWLGRKICVRLHLAAYLLQKLYNLTDRQVEYGMKDNAVYQVFCGLGIVGSWHAPDHTKIEEFRSRLTPETQRALTNELAKFAVVLGFGDASEVDIDSTAQEANISYPADATLMPKLAAIAKKVVDYLHEKTRGLIPEDLNIDMKAIKEKAREYLFLAKTTIIEKRREVFKELHRLVKSALRPVVEVCDSLDPRRLKLMPWNIRRAAEQVRADAWRYLLDVGHFTRTNTIKAGKILAFHAKAVACIKKGKVGKDKEFGRVFQLGRIKGNFLYVLESTSLRMDDKQSFARTRDHIWRGYPQISECRQRLLGCVKSAGTDETWRHREWAAASRQYQKPRGSCERRNASQAQGPPSRDRTFDRSRETRRTTWQEQNEIGRGHLGCRLRICLGAEYAPADPASGWQDEESVVRSDGFKEKAKRNGPRTTAGDGRR